jgi:hypothetical protein
MTGVIRLITFRADVIPARALGKLLWRRQRAESGGSISEAVLKKRHAREQKVVDKSYSLSISHNGIKSIVLPENLYNG